MLSDVRLALRGLLRVPGFTAVAVLTLALGIGANTALFSVADAVLLKPLPYPDPERIVRIDAAPYSFSAAGMGVTKEMAASRAFTAVGIYVTGGLNAGGEPHSERLRAAAVSPGFFGAIGAPVIGRAFTDDDVANTPHVAVISYSVWTSRFNGDPTIGRRPLILNGQPYTVLGVLPPRAVFPDRSDVWVPGGAVLQITGAAFAPRTIARLALGVSPLQARDEVDRINHARAGGKRDASERPVVVTSLRDELVGNVRPLLFVVAAAVLLVLLVACINTANLLLARATARDREMAVRRALGVSGGRLVRYLLIESGVLAAFAGLTAIPVAFWTLDAVRALLPDTIHGVQEIAIDARAAAATAALSIAATLIFGLAPALSVRRRPSVEALRGLSTTADPFWRRFRSVLVAAELAAAVILLAGAMTVVRTVWSLMAVDLGARGERVLTLQLTLPRTQYPTAAQASAFYDRLHPHLQRIGIEAAGASSTMPGSSEMGIALGAQVEGLPMLSGERQSALFVKASPDYFRALGIDVIAGRAFSEADRAGAPAVAIVSASFPKRVGVTPETILGRLVDVGFRDKPQWATIVGVVGDVRLGGPEHGAGPALYMPYAQSWLPSSSYVAIKSLGDPRDLVGPVREAVRAVDPDLPPYNIRTFDEIRASFVADRRFAMALMLAFAGLAGLLSAIGLYGVTSYLVQLRTREIGIRVAIGATPTRIVRHTMRGGLVNAAIGVVVGVAAAAALSRLFISKVPGLQQVDTVTLALTAIAMLTVAAWTTWLPARRAARIDPVEALRAEG